MNDLTTADDRGIAPLQAKTEMGQFMELLERAARDPLVDVAKMGALLDMKERVLNKQAIAEFNQDYLAAKLEMPRVKKDGVVEYAVNKAQPDGPKKEAFRFATIENIESIIEPIERKYGFSHYYTQAPRPGDGGGGTTTIFLLHRSGHQITSEFSVGLDSSGGKSNMQGMHSSHSLAKRVCLMSVWNVVYEGKDDSGVAAGIRFITDEQKDELINLIKETSSDTVAFLRRFGVSEGGIDALEVGNFTTAKNMLMAKKRKMENPAS